MSAEYLFDAAHWSVEPPDPSVGIFGEAWSHESCTKEYDLGVDFTETMHGPEIKGYVATVCRLHCLDCGTVTEFASDVFVGFSEEEMLASWERGEA